MDFLKKQKTVGFMILVILVLVAIDFYINHKNWFSKEA